MPKPTKERAERIARSHACVRCKEYSWKKLMVKPAAEPTSKEWTEVWHVTMQCGVCGAHQEIGIDADGDIVDAG